MTSTIVSVEPFPQQGQAEGGIMRLGIINSLQPQGLSPWTFVSVSIASSHDYFLLFEQTTQDSLRNAECRRCFSLACFWQFVMRFWGGYVFHWEKMPSFFPIKISVFMQHQSRITRWKQTGYRDRITVALFVFPMCCMKRHQMSIWLLYLNYLNSMIMLRMILFKAFWSLWAVDSYHFILNKQ